jgi:hypothetical protein
MKLAGHFCSFDSAFAVVIRSDKIKAFARFTPRDQQPSHRTVPTASPR